VLAKELVALERDVILSQATPRTTALQADAGRVRPFQWETETQALGGGEQRFNAESRSSKSDGTSAGIRYGNATTSGNATDGPGSRPN
jgi:hypothetical protein